MAKAKPDYGDGKADAATGAYFKSLRVRNVRCFGPDDQTLDLTQGAGRPAPWTVILGNNGTGKTTLLQCLAVCSVYGLSRYTSLGQTRRFKAEGGATAAEIPVSPVLAVQVEDDSRLQLRPSTVGESYAAFVILEQFDDRAAGTRPQGQGVPVVICYGYGAARRSGFSSLSPEPEEETGLASLFDERVEPRNAEEFLLRLDYSAKSQTSERERKRRERQRDQVSQLLTRVLPGVYDVRFAVGGLHPGVEFETDDGWVPLRRVGYGYQTTVAWLVDFMSRMVERYPDSHNPLAEPAVVLVDEIDLHLHPTCQRTLMSHLSEHFPNTQFIVSAHSPLFVQAAEGANLVVLRRDPGKRHVVIDNDVEAIKNWRIDQVLTSDLFGLPTARPPQLDALIQKRKKLLTKANLTAADRGRLAKLEAEIGPLPTGETAKDVETTKLLEQTLRVLRESAGNGE